MEKAYGHESNISENPFSACDWFTISNSIIRCKARTRVLLALSLGGILSTTGLCKQTRMSRNSVIGALRGMGNRFHKETSLIYLGLVTKVEDENDCRISGYQITKLGRQALEKLENEEQIFRLRGPNGF